MRLSVQHLSLPLLHPFTLGNGSSRTHTAISLVYIEHGGIVGTGEAAMPPYLGESHSTVDDFVARVDLSKLLTTDNLELIHLYVDTILPGNSAIKAAINMAMYDWWGKKQEQSLSELVGTKKLAMPITAGTIGITPLAGLAEKVSELTAAGFRKLKVKLGGPNDKESIQEIRQHSDLPITVDVNQGWTDTAAAINLAFWLADQGVLLIEQAFPKEELEKLGQLKAKSPIPIFADESCQRLADIEKVAPFVDGINVKLMKCTGIWEAQKMVEKASDLGLKTMLGCMTETSCATYAALAIAPLFNFVDIDGPWILKEQPFLPPKIEAGKLLPSTQPGLGLELK